MGALRQYLGIRGPLGHENASRLCCTPISRLCRAAVFLSKDAKIPAVIRLKFDKLCHKSQQYAGDMTELYFAIHRTISIPDFNIPQGRVGRLSLDMTIQSTP